MSVPWSLTVTTFDRIDTVMDDASDREDAVTALLAATQDALAAAERSGALAARYELRAAGALVALIQTGTDQHGNPDYGATRALIQRIAAT